MVTTQSPFIKRVPLCYLIHIVVGVGCSWVRYWTWCWYRWKSPASAGRLPPACTEPHTHFSSAFARALLWGLPRAAGLHWGASSTYSKKSQGHLCYWHQVTDRLISPAKSFSEASALYLVSSMIPPQLPEMKTATNQRRSQESFQYPASLWWTSQASLLRAARHRPTLNHSPHDVIKEKERQVSVWCPMSILFLNLKSNL